MHYNKKSTSNSEFWVKKPNLFSSKWTYTGMFSVIAQSKAGMNKHVLTFVSSVQAQTCWPTAESELEGSGGLTVRHPCYCLEKEVVAKVWVRQGELFQDNVIFHQVSIWEKRLYSPPKYRPLLKSQDGSDHNTAILRHKLLQRKQAFSPHRNYLCG